MLRNSQELLNDIKNIGIDINENLKSVNNFSTGVSFGTPFKGNGSIDKKFNFESMVLNEESYKQ